MSLFQCLSKCTFGTQISSPNDTTSQQVLPIRLLADTSSHLPIWPRQQASHFHCNLGSGEGKWTGNIGLLYKVILEYYGVDDDFDVYIYFHLLSLPHTFNISSRGKGNDSLPSESLTLQLLHKTVYIG